MRKILVAPNAFRDNLKAVEAGKAIKEGLQAALPGSDIFILPVADGGDGSFEVISSAKEPEIISVNSKDPLNRDIASEIAILPGKTAFIELAKFSGLNLLDPSERNPLDTGTYGTGLAMKKAMEENCNEILLAVGGSGTVDAGTGILSALGFRLNDPYGNPLPPGGAALKNLDAILLPHNIEQLKKVKIKILCDVKNPLLGEEGAANIFGPQKGAGAGEVETLEKALQNFAGVVHRQTGMDISHIPHGGASGGVPAGLMPFLKIELLSGAEEILDILNFNLHLEKADLVITAEGKLDRQSVSGKAPVAVAARARAAGKPVIFLGGSIPGSLEEQDNELFTSVFSIAPGPVSLMESMENAAEWLKRTSFNIARTLTAGQDSAGKKT